MPSCLRSPKLCLANAIFNLIMGGVLIFLGEWVTPDATARASLAAITLDTEDKLSKAYDALPGALDIGQKLTVFNLTNGAAMMSQNPAPKPIFEEVVITLKVEMEFFDYQLSSDKSEFTYKTWAYVTTDPPSDMLKTVVTVNGALPTIMGLFGGELAMQGMYTGAFAAGTAAVGSSLDLPTTLGAGCASFMPPTLVPQCVGVGLMYAALSGDKLTLGPDGTGALNVGLFVKRTVNEILHGYIDPLTSTPLSPSPIPGLLQGLNFYPTRAALEAAIASNAVDPRMFETTKLTGTTSADDLGRYVNIRSYTDTNATHNKPEWFLPHVSYDNSGNTGAIRNPGFNYKNLRSSSQPMPPANPLPSVLQAGVVAPKANPSQKWFSIFVEGTLLREVSYSCGACTSELLHGELSVVKYSMDESNLWLNVSGKQDPTGACASTATCDYGTIIPGSFVHPNFVFTKPYFGDSLPELIDSVTFKSAGGAPRAFDAATMSDAIYVEPFTGTAAKTLSFSQFNWPGVNALSFNDALYANVFSGASFPAVWPYLMMESSTTLNQNSATFKDSVAGIQLAYIVMLLSDIGGLNSFIWAVLFLYKFYSLTTTASKTGPRPRDDSKSKDPVHKGDNKTASPQAVPQTTMTVDISRNGTSLEVGA